MILIVDNQVDLIEPQIRFVEKMGYKLQIVDSAAEALGFIDMVRPGLIILDLMSPKLAGLQLLREIKAGPSFAGIPVIVYTTQSDPKLRANSLALGASEFLVKGEVSRSEILERINHYYLETSPPIPEATIEQPTQRPRSLYQPWTVSHSQRMKFLLAESRSRILRSSALLGQSRKYIPSRSH